MHHHTTAAFPVVIALFMYALPGGDNAKAEAARKELKRLAGTWECAFMGSNGRVIRSDLGRFFGDEGHRMTILEDGSLVRKTKDGRRFKYRLDPTARPKTWDYLCSPDKGGDKLVTVGIYELDDNELVICYAASGHPRPTDFTFNRGSYRFFEIWHRVKDKK